MIELLNSEKYGAITKLTRKEKIWSCSECNKEFLGTVPPQCSCGATDKVFVEKEALVKETGRKLYTVVNNFIYTGKTIEKDTIVSLIVKDRITKGFIERNLIKEVIEEKIGDTTTLDKNNDVQETTPKDNSSAEITSPTNSAIPGVAK